MTLFFLGLLFVSAITVHNLEEALFLPSWSVSAGRWHQPVGAGEFRFAVGILTLLAYIIAYLAIVGGKGSVGVYLLTGYALAMLLNVFFPHLLATIALRRYVPGLITAVLLNLPIMVFVLQAAIREGYIQVTQFLWTGAIMTVALLGALPLLFDAGRFLLKRTSKEKVAEETSLGLGRLKGLLCRRARSQELGSKSR